MKKYDNPMLQVVSIKKCDIITESVGISSTNYNGETILSAGRRNVFDEWYEGY